MSVRVEATAAGTRRTELPCVVCIIAVVKRDVLVSRLGPPDLGGHVDHQRLGKSSGVRR
jgi:hypothetical protein